MSEIGGQPTILDPKRLDSDTSKFLHGLRKRFKKYARKEGVPGYYARAPYDLIVIDAQFLRKVGLLEPDIVIPVALHELHHALHPWRSRDEDAWKWSHRMVRLLAKRGYVSPRFKNPGNVETDRRKSKRVKPSKKRC